MAGSFALLLACPRVAEAPLDGGATDAAVVDARTSDAFASDAHGLDAPLLDANELDAPTLADTDVADAAACGVAELCNALDDDCDRIVDEGCTCGAAAPVPWNENMPPWDGPSGLVETPHGTLGGFYGPRARIQRIGADGLPIGDATPIERPSSSVLMAARGDDVALVVTRDDGTGAPMDKVLRRFDAARGAFVGDPIVLAPASVPIDLVATSAGHAIALARPTGVEVVLLSPDGSLGAPTTVSTALASTVAIASDGAEGLAVALTQPDLAQGVWLQRLSASLAPVGEPISLGVSMGARGVALAGDHDGWLVGWSEPRDTPIPIAGPPSPHAHLIAHVTSAGEPDVLPIEVQRVPYVDALAIQVALDPAGRFGVVTNDVDFDIYRTRFSLYAPDGTPSMAPVIVPDAILLGRHSFVFSPPRGEFAALLIGFWDGSAAYWPICTPP